MTQEPHDLDDAGLRDRAVAAATGRAPFDLLLAGGRVVDVATSEIRAADVGIVGGLIASVHAPGTRADAGRVIALEGALVAPGLIDMHMHIESSMTTPRRYAEVVVPQGTTTVVWDPHEVGNVAGLDGVDWAARASGGLPLRVLVLAPSCVPSAPGIEVAGAEFGPDEMARMLGWDRITGVAEVMDMRGVLSRSPKMRGIVDAGLASGKLVCGHGRGLEGADLQGFVAAGIGSDHEITSGEDLLEKLRAGLTVELRGSHDYVLPGAVAALAGLPHLPQTLTLCTDDVFPDDLVTVGGLIDVIRRLVRYGMPAVDALRAATLNAAMRLGRRDLGLVAPGRRADLVVLGDLDRLEVLRVFAGGAEVARDGALTGGVPGAEVADFADTVKLAPLAPADFVLRAPEGTGDRVEINTVFRPRFTEWRRLEVAVVDGVLDLPDDKLVMAVIHRHGRRTAVPSLGVLDDWGSWRGAIATTIAHDSHNLCVFGRDPVDMAAAANALIACGGGMAVARGGAVIALLPLPVCGLLSDAPATETALALATLRAAAAEVADWAPPLRTFKALTGASLACNPGPRVTDLGLGDGATGELRGLFEAR
ncbi:adenine deaminase [Frigidibacter sp. MR17.24]|uniref:adenine deaminase n=1 Tax=Frigidibacter sp. MR17.24 TaxID=3127345 RepID=UPI003012E2FB